MNAKYPKVSFIVPVLNAASLLPNCLAAIKNQDYPSEKMEIVIADGGSKDNTVKIAKEYGALVYDNKLKTAESGKAVGVKNSTGDFVIFIDSDNILPTADWLKKMLTPLLKNEELFGADPLYFTYRKEDGFIDRYCALIGMNDPLCMWIGSYDRMNVLTGKWTGLPVKYEKRDGYLELFLESAKIPTLGANGAVFRSSVLKKYPELFEKYLFDMDVVEKLVSEKGFSKFAKVETGIIHLYCGSSLRRFMKKQLRRVKDFLYRRPVGHVFVTPTYDKRKYKYGHNNVKSFTFTILRFIIDCVLVVPLLAQVVKGYSKKKDWAWFAHPVLCWLTLLVYARGTIESFFTDFGGELSRSNW